MVKLGTKWPSMMQQLIGITAVEATCSHLKLRLKAGSAAEFRPLLFLHERFK
jgi:hypothetical protein